MSNLMGWLEKNTSVIYLGGKGIKESDIDYYLQNKKDSNKIRKYLLKHDYIEIKNNFYKNHLIFKKGNKTIHIQPDFKSIFTFFPGINFKKSFLKQYMKNPYKNKIPLKTIKILFSKNKFRHSFLKENKKVIIKNNYYLDILTKNPFRKDIDFSDLKKISSKKIFTLLKYLKPKYFVYYIAHYLKYALSKINSGKIIVFIGADGSGKSTIINEMSKYKKSICIYMGSSEYVFEKIIHSKSKNMLFKMMRFALVYFENWFKILKAFRYKLTGKDVFIDRYPSYQYFTNKPNIKNMIWKVFYSYLFYRPKNMVILYETPENIYKRKKELTKYHIEMFYKKLRKNVNNKNYFWIKNTDINTTIMEINKRFYSD